LYDSFCDVDEDGTGGLFFSEPLILLGLFLLGHHSLQDLTQCKCRSITREINLSGLMAPWLRWKGTLAWGRGRGVFFKINRPHHPNTSILDAMFVGLLA
jgi:hypothetical protein